MSAQALPLRHSPPARPRRARLPVAAAAASATGLLLLAAVLGSFGAAGILQSGGCQQPASAAPGQGLPGPGRTVIATTYGGPGDPTSTHTGAANPANGHAANLDGKMAWAELGAPPSSSATFAQAHRLADLLAGVQPPQTVGGDAGRSRPLPYGLPLQITAPGGRKVVAYKLDIGAGAPGAAIDIWYDTALALDLPGAAAGGYKGPVRIAPAPPGTPASPDAGAVPSPTANLGPGSVGTAGNPTLPSGGGCTAPGGPVSGVQARIVQIAQRELQVGVDAANGKCLKYGPCQSEAWCALFLTWVWRQARVPIPSTAASNLIYTWAQQHTHVYPPSVMPQPGWAALEGTGPQDTSTSVHVALVERVLPGRQITLINGNWSNAVIRTGPCRPQDQIDFVARCAAGESDHTLYGYAAPTA